MMAWQDHIVDNFKLFGASDAEAMEKAAAWYEDMTIGKWAVFEYPEQGTTFIVSKVDYPGQVHVFLEPGCKIVEAYEIFIKQVWDAVPSITSLYTVIKPRAMWQLAKRHGWFQLTNHESFPKDTTTWAICRPEA